MNLGGASNVDLSEAARMLKQSTVGAGAGVQNQQVPPPMMLMQQAVAMQQFQFQQALLMQQVMATQQAAARAATVKSAQEMAAARAAEISKLLKGNEPEVEEENKKSPLRSMSRTPSRSRSRSRSCSRSKSRSPLLRYRRDRSPSRSPIRYRRDSSSSRPSPISREYFGYRGRSRRGYYRGRGEYGWNPSYRRDWERERPDHYSSRSLRRSRSRSRSRVRRRSRSRSRSPRSRRDRSCSPPRGHRRGRRRSRSLEGTRASRSRSHSRSRSRSESSFHREQHGSPGGGPSIAENLSPVRSNDTRSVLMRSPGINIKEKVDSDDLEQVSSRPKESRDEGSVSPARSLSVSLSPPRRGELEGGEKANDWKKAMLRGSALVDEVAEPFHDGVAAPSVGVVEDGDGSPAALLLEPQEIDTKGAFRSKGGEFVAKGRYTKKESGRMEESDESDGSDEEVDDWRDDIKANELEKIKRKESKREMERKEEEKRAFSVPVVVQEEVKDHGMTLLEHLGRGTGKLSVDYSPFAPEVPGGAAFRSTKGISSNDLVSVEPDEARVNCNNRGLFVKEEIPDRVSTGNGEGYVEMDEEEAGGVTTHEKSTGSADVIDREGDSDLVFEGPMLPPEEDLHLEVSERLEGHKDCDDSGAEEIGAEAPPSVAVEEVIVNHLRRKDKSNSREEKSRAKDDDELYEKRKLKEKSRSRERSRSKRYDDDTDHERRKEKHRKHKRRHRRDGETEKEEDDDDEKRDVAGSKDKEERRHHRSKKHRSSGRDHKEEKREKKRRRHHKHRGNKSPSESSPDVKESSLVAEAEGEDVDQVQHKKQSSSRKQSSRKEVSKSPVHASGSDSD